MSGRRQVVVSVAIAAVLAGSGCGPSAPDADGPELFVPLGDALQEIVPHERYRLLFGKVALGRNRMMWVRLLNAGTAPLEIRGLGIPGPEAAPFGVLLARADVPPGGATGLIVAFEPLDAGETEAVLSFSTNDETAPRVQVELVGAGYHPLVGVAPAQLDFGSVVVGTEKRLTLELTGTGGGEGCVRLGGIEPTAARSSYAVDPGTSEVDIPVPVDTARPLEVAFRPLAAGAMAAELRLEPCDGSPPVVVGLSGEGIVSGLVADPAAALDFGTVTPGGFAVRVVRFGNVGNAPIRFTSLGLRGVADPVGDPAFSLASVLELPRVLDPLSELEVPIRFRPEDTHGHIAALAWQTDEPRGASGSVVLTGKGGGGTISVTPSPVSFGTVAVGTPLRRTVVVTDTGESALSIQRLSLEGDPAFRIVEAPPDPVLEAGESERVTVEYLPGAAGDASGRLVFESDDALRPRVEVALAGAGEDLPPCDLAVAPTDLDFGMIEEGRRVELPITLSNPLADADCLVRDLATTEDTSPAFDLVGGPVDTLRLAPGARERLRIGFTAGITGLYTGALTMQVSDPVRPARTVPLTASALEPAVKVAPGSLDFGVVAPPCGIATREVCMTNTGSVPVTVEDVTIAGDPDGFSVRSRLDRPGEAGLSRTLGSGGQACVVVDFVPGSPGLHEAAVRIDLDLYLGPLVVPVSGTGSTDAGSGPGCLQGRVSTASSRYWVPGASVQVEVPGDAGEARILEARTDCDGFFYLPGVPAGPHVLDVRVGSFSASPQIDVPAPVTILEDPIPLDAGTPSVAVFLDGADDIERYLGLLLGATGRTLLPLPADTPPTPAVAAFVADLAALETRDVIALDTPNPVFATSEPAATNLRTFVADGGTLFVSGVSHAYLEGLWPGMIRFDDGSDAALAGPVPLTVDDPVWQACLGLHPVYDQPPPGRSFPRVTALDPAVETLVSGDLVYATGEIVPDAPLVVTFGYGKGRVFFAAFEHGLSDDPLTAFDLRLLAYAMLRL